jgi:hypothetical protein
MRANEGKAILVALDLLYRNHPSFNGVTRLAIGAQLTFMNVGMAIGTLGAYVGEDGLGVASGAAYALVHAAQWIAGAIVVKFRNRAKRFPTQRGMTILTWQVQISVRTAGLGVALSLSARRYACGQQRQQQSCQNRRKHGCPTLLVRRSTAKNKEKFRKNELTNSLTTKKDGIQISNPTPKRISGWTSARKVTEGTVPADMGRMTGLLACSVEVSSLLWGRKNLLLVQIAQKFDVRKA